VAKLVFEGAVSNLDRLDDFAVTYMAVDAGVAAGVGAEAVTMRIMLD
jgi:hypothetical protein